MSQTHIEKSKAAPPPLEWWKIALGPAFVIVLFCAIWMIFNAINSVPSNYETANGKIMELRKTVDGVAESNLGSRVLYGVEVRVQYALNGRTQERWLRASDNLSQETLLLKLAGHPIECLVYWPLNHPENARCWIE